MALESTPAEAKQRHLSFRHSGTTESLVQLPATLGEAFVLSRIGGVELDSSPRLLSLSLPQALS